MKKLLLALLFAPLCAFASGGPALNLDRAPDRANDQAALQRGAKVFVNYCLNCHSASFFRYNKLREIGLTDQQIIDNLMFTAEKIGEPMTTSLRRADAKAFFGAAPPDLTLVARARTGDYGSGSDWLYTYLRSFYQDSSRPTGWNNVVFPNVGMPHALWELQGTQTMGADHKLALAVPGKMSPKEYDELVADLVGFLKFMAEPAAEFRKNLGVVLLLGLTLLGVLAYALKREYWKDVH